MVAVSIILLVMMAMFMTVRNHFNLYNAEKRLKCLEQVVEILRAYNREPEQETDAINDAIEELTNVIFSDMIQYVSDEDKAEFIKQFNRSR